MSRAPLEPVTLRGAHVELRPLEQAHAEGLIRAYVPGTMDLMSRTDDVLEPLSAEDAQRYVQEALGGRAQGRYLPFTVFDLATGDVLGATRFGDIDLTVPRMEIGWTWYAPSARGTVTNPECKLLLLAYAFDGLGCEVVTFRTSAFNMHSRAAIAKLGATRDGVLRRNVHQRDGRLRDTVVYSILREDWPRVRTGLHARGAAEQPAP